jgi:hypothetical protein
MISYLPPRALAQLIRTMLRPASNQQPRSARVRALVVCVCALCSLVPAAWAGRPVRVYEVDVDGQSAPALQDAMRQALVRATGRREAAADPAFASMVADAPKYVKTYATGPRGETQVVFDAAAVEQGITGAGRSVWDRVRPFTLVVLAPPRNRAAEDAARVELERVAAERGLPISLVPLAADDAGGNPLGVDALRQAAQRYGADEILVGRGEDAGPDSVLQWTLYTRVNSESWSGPLISGIEHTVDFLVPQQGGSLAQAESVAQVRIEGVGTLADYAGLERLLQSVPGVRRANIAAAEANSVTFEVTVRGGVTGLEQGLAGSSRLVRSASAGAQAVFRYQPQG